MSNRIVWEPVARPLAVVLAVAVLAVAVLAVAVVAAAPPGDPVAAAPCWEPPVEGRVVDPFRRPACPWCPGNRGLEYAVGENVPVRAVAGGRVTFAGTVAGVRYVVVRHRDGRRATYGRLVSSAVDTSDVVVARTILGRATDRFHFGIRVGGTHVDPQPLLGRRAGPPRLVPIDGSPQRTLRPDQLRCASLVAGTRVR